MDRRGFLRLIGMAAASFSIPSTAFESALADADLYADEIVSALTGYDEMITAALRYYAPILVKTNTFFERLIEARRE